jgi:hypothetical protein
VTCACAAWLWRLGSRVIVPEVGLTHEGSFLEPPWGSWYRVDLAASVGRRTHVIEVKGSRSDLAREDLTSGKWQLFYPHLTVWLAYDASVDRPDLHERWGLLKVAGARVDVVRPAREVDDPHRERHLAVLASVLCMQSLPKMMGLTHAGQLSALETDGFSRPWRRWIQEPRLCEEDGHIL